MDNKRRKERRKESLIKIEKGRETLKNKQP